MNVLETSKRHRKQWLARSYVGLLLGFVPVRIVRHVLWEHYSNLPSSWAYYSLHVIEGVTNSAAGFMMAQILVWWQWKPPSEHRTSIFVILVAASHLGTIISTPIVHLESPVGFFPELAVGLVHDSLAFVSLWIVIYLVGGFFRFRFEDQTETPILKKNIPSDGMISISTLLVLTLFSALAMVFFSVAHLLYANRTTEITYLSSGIGNFVWMCTVTISDVFALVATSLFYVRRRGALAIAILLLVPTTSILGRAFWAMADEDYGFADLLSLGGFVIVLTDSLGKVLLHLIAFRCWSGAGYELTSSKVR